MHLNGRRCAIHFVPGSGTLRACLQTKKADPHFRPVCCSTVARYLLDTPVALFGTPPQIYNSFAGRIVPLARELRLPEWSRYQKNGLHGLLADRRRAVRTPKTRRIVNAPTRVQPRRCGANNKPHGKTVERKISDDRQIFFVARASGSSGSRVSQGSPVRRHIPYSTRPLAPAVTVASASRL
jgi:hypothetical protein